jgi:hypothetical protein
MTPLSHTRRIELLERQLAAQERTIRGLLGRQPRGGGKRWAYLAKTIKVGSSYPVMTTISGATFGLQFLDREFTPAEFSGVITDKPRATKSQAFGRTINGQWVLEGEVVLAFPAPPPPGTTGKGRWWIQAQPYYYGKLVTALAANGTASMTVWRPTASGWEATAHTIRVRDWFLRFARAGTTLAAGTGLRVEWVQNPAVASQSCFAVTEASCLAIDLF